MLGIPDGDVAQVKEWAQSRVYMNFGDRPVQEQAHHAENLILYWRYCQDLVRSRLRSPQDDLPGDLARIYLQGDQTLTPEEIAGLGCGAFTEPAVRICHEWMDLPPDGYLKWVQSEIERWFFTETACGLGPAGAGSQPCRPRSPARSMSGELAGR